jgi:hypothetical protein
MSTRIVTGDQNFTGNNGDNFILVGRGTTLGLADNSSSFIVALGADEAVSLFPPDDTHETIVDFAQGLNIFVSGHSSLTVFDFGRDKTGHITMINAGFRNVADAVASERRRILVW